MSAANRQQKFLNLPDVDLSAPDVYESTPVAGSQCTNSGVETDASYTDPSIESSSHRPVKMTAGRFKDALLDTNNTDFVEALYAHRRQAYRSLRRLHPTDLPVTASTALDENGVTGGREYSSGSLTDNGEEPGSVLVETPLQKLKRLLFETAELEASMAGKQQQQEPATTALILDSLQQLQQRLNGIHLVDDVTVRAGADVARAEQLLKQLTVFQQTAAAKTTDAAAAQESNSDGVKYELFYSPELSRSVEQTRLAELNDRLVRLETAVGADQLDSLGNGVRLVELLNRLERQFAILTQPSLLEGALQKCRQLKTELDSLSSGNAPKQALDSKLEQLYKVTERAEEMMDIVPLLVERLHSLQSVHRELVGFAEAARTVGEEQSHVNEMVKHALETIQRVEKNLAANQTVIEKNVK